LLQTQRAGGIGLRWCFASASASLGCDELIPSQKENVMDKEDTLTVGNLCVNEPYFIKPSYDITFSNPETNSVIGRLDFNGAAMKFEGNAEESAKIFFKLIAVAFDERLKEERQAAKAAMQQKGIEHVSDECPTDITGQTALATTSSTK
jgi:hypothetical protein